MKLLRVLFFLPFSFTVGYGQIISPSFIGFTVSRSALTFGAGEQGAALDGGLATMQYNPATIASLSIIYFESGKRDAFIDPAYGLSWYRFGFHLKEIGSFALEYSQIDLGEFWYTTSADNPNGYLSSTPYHAIDRSYALSYAAGVSGSVSLGGAIRYIHSNIFSVEHVFFSSGILYQPVELNKQLSVGFSLTDFGTPIHSHDIAQGDPAPAYMRLGVAASPISNDNQKLTFLFEGSRLVADVDDSYNGKSSFTALFSSFKYWPHDIMGHGGLIYNFPDIAITGSMHFHQQIVFGVFDQTIHSSKWNEMTASIAMGFTVDRFTLDFALASVWQYISENGRNNFWSAKSIPDEELELKLSYFYGEKIPAPSEDGRTTLTAGTGALTPLGRMKDFFASNGVSYSIELIHYTSTSTAIVSSVSYNDNKTGGIVKTIDADGKWQSYVISMMYRYDFREQHFPLFLQAGPTLFRWQFTSSSPNILARPRYSYLGGAAIETGISVSFYKITIEPFLNFLSMLSTVTGDAPRLGGYNQWSFGIRLGTEL